MTSNIRYRIVVTASILLLSSSAVVEGGFAGGVDSGISGVVTRAACGKQRACRPSAMRPFVQVAREGDREVVVTSRIRDYRFHLTLQPGMYVVRLVRTANAVGTGGRRVAVRPHAFTLVVLRA